MKYLKAGILFFLLSQIWVLDVVAQTSPYPDYNKCLKEPTKIVYANGILGVLDDSKTSAIVMLKTVAKKMKTDLVITHSNNASIYGWGYCHDITWDVQFNPSDNKLLDLYQAWIQLVGGDPANFTRGIFGILPWPVEFQSKVLEIGSKYATPATNSDLFQFANKYQSEKHPVGPTGQEYPWRYIIISHSQGNFFTNDMNAKYFSNRGNISEIRLISAANPDNEVGGGGEYVTLLNDEVIKKIVLFVNSYNLISDPDLPLPMPSNTVNSGVGIPIGTGFDADNHNFLISYFGAGSNSETKLVQLISDQVDLVPFTRKDPTDPAAEIPLEPAGTDPTTGIQEACPGAGFSFSGGGYECTKGLLTQHCHSTGPSCNAN